ncbi:MAG TPA: NBR1-Ig-like domain-containing protein [Gaiellaceae bacterium]|nr:NBR1-Ig-like domain-containing protein [Gaiellaceae bacterium]
MSNGPLAVEWGNWAMAEPRAGTRMAATLELVNAGSMAWGDGVFASYHWLDDRGNPIVWDGIRTAVPPIAPGERTHVAVDVRAPIPPGRYRLAFDMVSEHRAWFSELGSAMLERDLRVEPRVQEPNALVPPDVVPAPDWAEHIRAAHADGYAVVAGAIAWDGGLLSPRPRALAQYEPGSGRVPGFTAPLICPSVADGVELDRLEDVAGLPAYAAPRDEPWIYDGRAVLTVRPRSGRRPT